MRVGLTPDELHVYLYEMDKEDFAYLQLPEGEHSFPIKWVERALTIGLVEFRGTIGKWYLFNRREQYTWTLMAFKFYQIEKLLKPYIEIGYSRKHCMETMDVGWDDPSWARKPTS